MDSLIVIRIPEEIKARIGSFCRERGYAPDDLMVTLVEPALLDQVSGLEQKLQSFCLMQSDYKLVLGGPAVFNNQLLYLNVLPGNIAVSRSKLITFLKIADNKSYRPHLTIMRNTSSHPLDMNRMLADAKAQFSTPSSFTVSEMHLYTRENERSPFKPRKTYQFTGR